MATRGISDWVRAGRLVRLYRGIYAVGHGVEAPQSGVWIGSYEADFVWTRAGLVVELDGFAAHRTRSSFNADRLRDRRLWRAGLRTMRLTSEALDDEDAVLDDLAYAGVNVPSRSRASSKPPSRSSTSPASVR